jgi:hypothetical protein
MTEEPTSIAATLKVLAEALATVWRRGGALLLGCITTACAVAFLALLAAAHWHLTDAAQLLAKYGLWLFIAILVFAVCTGFKTYSERSGRPLSIIAFEQESNWAQSKQPAGNVLTMLQLHFQVTNFSDGAVMISGARLKWPWVRRRSILHTQFHVQNQSPIAGARTYSRMNPVQPNSLTYGTVNITVDHPVGKIGRSMRVVIAVQDHARQWYWLWYSHLKNANVSGRQG